LAPPYDVVGVTWDDIRDLPEGTLVRLAGVRVEVLDGPKIGSVSVSDDRGEYRLPGMPAGPVRLRVSKEGYASFDESSALNSAFGPTLTVGHAPHTLWGNVFEATGTSAPPRIADVQVRAFTGANAGKVTTANHEGQYRLEDLVTADSVDVVFTRAGYQARSYRIADLRKNTRQDVELSRN
jgi:hypothetical protein